jgi:hypothetical protein
VLTDTDKDGRLTADDGETLFITDPYRGVEGKLDLKAPSTASPALVSVQRISGVTWSPIEELLVESAIGTRGLEDLFVTVPRPDPTASDTSNLTDTGDVRERRPRIDPTGSVAVFERIDATRKGTIWIYGGPQSPITTGGPGEEPLLGTPYVVGSDADPGYSPDGGSLVFRRMTGLGTRGLGTWDVLRVSVDGTGLGTLASGPLYRSAPDWGAKGIVFAETDDAGVPRLVVVQPDGSGRRVLQTLAAGHDIAYPHWLK